MLSQHELINISKFFICARLVCLECRVFIAGNLEIYTVQYILLLPCQSWVRILQIFLYQNVLSFTSENKTYSNYVLCNLVPASFLGILYLGIYRGFLSVTIMHIMGQIVGLG